jgi:hypothetical protein
MCIISTAQQASPKVIHMSEPVRAQVMRSSSDVTDEALVGELVADVREERVGVADRVPVAGSTASSGCEAMTRDWELAISPIQGLPSSTRTRSPR